MPKLFPYEDSHCVPWKYDVSLISTRTRKDEACSNISSGLSRLTRSGHCYTLEELEKRRKETDNSTVESVKNRVTTKEAEEFLKIIRNSKYIVIQQQNRLPAQISILALLLSFDVHREALLKVLKEACVSTSVTKYSFKGMVSMVLATNQIFFIDDELPPESRKQTLPMHSMVKCEDMIVSRVLIDNGLALNMCPMSTIELLNVDTSLIRPTTMIIRAFDGTFREVQVRIELAIGIGPRSFMVNVQVIKVDSPYNMLLGRPWLHAIGAVASTLHYRLKFPLRISCSLLWLKSPNHLQGDFYPIHWC